MRLLADTSFLIASLVEKHPHHERTKPWIEKILNKQIQLGVSSHSIAEVYAILTSLPISPRIPPGTAVQMITENLLQKAEIVELKTTDYLKCIRRASERGLHASLPLS